MSRSGQAAGDIYPCRFVKDGSADGTYLQAGAGDRTRGISFKDTRRSQYVDTSGKLAASGEPFSFYHQPGERCWLELGGTVALGDRIKSDTDGKGVTAGTDKNQYGAIADAAGVSGELIPVFVTVFGEAGI